MTDDPEQTGCTKSRTIQHHLRYIDYPFADQNGELSARLNGRRSYQMPLISMHNGWVERIPLKHEGERALNCYEVFLLAGVVQDRLMKKLERALKPGASDTHSIFRIETYQESPHARTTLRIETDNPKAITMLEALAERHANPPPPKLR